MPEIARFYGIVIKMYFQKAPRESASIHAIYNEAVGEFNIHTMQLIRGDLPRRAQALVREWLSDHREELLRMWDEKRVRPLPPLQ